jgi:SAM-dependent methyltransferase
VDAFLEHVAHARALGSAFELGLVDHLAARDGETVQALRAVLGGDGRGAELLLPLLAGCGVIELGDGRAALSPAFRRALRYRDLLEAKLEFAHLALPDLMQLFSVMLRSPEEFRRRARIYDLFSYGRCLEDTPENLDRTRWWMRFTTVLTRYEAGACAARHDFSRYRRMLDIGGNSGEFALQVCARNPRMTATVFDLPLVCRIGEEHVRRRPESSRIQFLPGDAFTRPVPAGHDLITFKSMLHDWPDDAATQLIHRASRSLEPGGTVLIFERGRLGQSPTLVPYSMIPVLLFAPAFRSPALYVDALRACGLRDVVVQQVDLDMPFSLVTASKPAETM